MLFIRMLWTHKGGFYTSAVESPCMYVCTDLEAELGILERMSSMGPSAYIVHT